MPPLFAAIAVAFHVPVPIVPSVVIAVVPVLATYAIEPKPVTAMLSVVEPLTVNLRVPLLVPPARETDVTPELDVGENPRAVVTSELVSRAQFGAPEVDAFNI